MEGFDKRLLHADHAKIIKKEGQAWETKREGVTKGEVQKHFTNGTKVGVPFIRQGESVTITAMLDLDDHDGAMEWSFMTELASNLMHHLASMGIYASPYRSGGGKGINLWMAWDEVQDAYSVRELLKEVIGEFGYGSGDGGVDNGEIEIFPKQNKVSAEGVGNCAAIPFRPLDLFTLEDTEDFLPWESSTPVPTIERKENKDSEGIELSEEQIDEMLEFIDPDLPYDEWKDVLMAIHAAGGTFEQAETWSKRGASYTEQGLTTRKWDSFNGTGGITGRTLMKLASDGGWEGDVVKADLDQFPEAEEKKSEVSGEVKKLVGDFIATLKGAMKRKGMKKKFVKVDEKAVTKAILSVYFDPKKGKYNALTSFGKLNQYSEPKAPKPLRKDLGEFVDVTAFGIGVKTALSKIEFKSAAQQVKAEKELWATPWTELLDFAHLYSQFSRTNFSVDMFSKYSKMNRGKHSVDISFKWEPLKGGKVEMKYVDDYRDHFPEFDDFLDLMVAARFAKDRKQAFLWLKCESNWGKSFLLSVLGDLGLKIEMAPKEVEAMVEGKPCGKTEVDFVGAFVAAFEEFKSVKSELKQLESSVSFSPKNASEITVQLYLKLFLSANDVPSLAGSRGVEEQFANRFNYYEGKGRLDRRRLFIENQGAYFTSVRNYVAERINEGVKRMIALGKYDSVTEAAKELAKFHGKYGIANTRKSIGDGVKEVAEEFRQEAMDHVRNDSFGPFKEAVEVAANGVVILKRPNKVLDDWLHIQFDKSEVFTWVKLKKEILHEVDEKGLRTRKMSGGKTVKAIDLGEEENDEFE